MHTRKIAPNSPEWSQLCAECSAPLESTATACPECGMAVLSLKSPSNPPKSREKFDFSRVAPTIASYLITDFRDSWTLMRSRARYVAAFVVVVVVLEASIAYLLLGGVLPWEWDLGRRILASGILVWVLAMLMLLVFVRLDQAKRVLRRERKQRNQSPE